MNHQPSVVSHGQPISPGVNSNRSSVLIPDAPYYAITLSDGRQQEMSNARKLAMQNQQQAAAGMYGQQYVQVQGQQGIMQLQQRAAQPQQVIIQTPQGPRVVQMQGQQFPQMQGQQFPQMQGQQLTQIQRQQQHARMQGQQQYVQMQGQQQHTQMQGQQQYVQMQGQQKHVQVQPQGQFVPAQAQQQLMQMQGQQFAPAQGQQYVIANNQRQSQQIVTAAAQPMQTYANSSANSMMTLDSTKPNYQQQMQRVEQPRAIGSNSGSQVGSNHSSTLNSPTSPRNLSISGQYANNVESVSSDQTNRIEIIRRFIDDQQAVLGPASQGHIENKPAVTGSVESREAPISNVASVGQQSSVSETKENTLNYNEEKMLDTANPNQLQQSTEQSLLNRNKPGAQTIARRSKALPVPPTRRASQKIPEKAGLLNFQPGHGSIDANLPAEKPQRSRDSAALPAVEETPALEAQGVSAEPAVKDKQLSNLPSSSSVAENTSGNEVSNNQKLGTQKSWPLDSPIHVEVTCEDSLTSTAEDKQSQAAQSPQVDLVHEQILSSDIHFEEIVSIKRAPTTTSVNTSNVVYASPPSSSTSPNIPIQSADQSALPAQTRDMSLGSSTASAPTDTRVNSQRSISFNSVSTAPVSSNAMSNQWSPPNEPPPPDAIYVKYGINFITSNATVNQIQSAPASASVGTVARSATVSAHQQQAPLSAGATPSSISPPNSQSGTIRRIVVVRRGTTGNIAPPNSTGQIKTMGQVNTVGQTSAVGQVNTVGQTSTVGQVGVMGQIKRAMTVPAQAIGGKPQGTVVAKGAPFISNCMGNKKALLIGVNYEGQQGELKGSVNAVKEVFAFLLRWGFQKDNIVALTDGHENTKLLPTRKNILNGMDNLVKGAKPNDSLFFLFVGHGGQSKNLRNEELDNMDSTIIPMDHRMVGEIVDDEMHKKLVKPLPLGCRFTALFDCSHSGSALDLPYEYKHDGSLKSYENKAMAMKAAKAGTSLITGNIFGAAVGIGMGLFQKHNTDKKVQNSIKSRTSQADVVMFSASKDGQVTADALLGGELSTGPLSHSFVTSLNGNPNQTYIQVLTSLRSIMNSAKFPQKPQLCAGRFLDMNTQFRI